MKRIVMALACLSLFAVTTPAFAQSETDAQCAETAYTSQMTQQDFEALQAQTIDFRGPGGPGGGFPGGPRPGPGGPGGGWNPGPQDHSWHFVGCGRRSKCVEMANNAGFPFGYAGIDANACPHDNACYGRY